jgi:hypothetical protein
VSGENGFARFRADPSKVRVCVRRDPEDPRYWRVVVCNFLKTPYYVGRARRALRGAAEECDMEGVDPDLQWTYDHPWGRDGVRARESLRRPRSAP